MKPFVKQCAVTALDSTAKTPVESTCLADCVISQGQTHDSDTDTPCTAQRQNQADRRTITVDATRVSVSLFGGDFV